MLLSAVAWAVLAVKGWQKALWLFVTIGGLYVVFPAGSFQKFQYLSTGDWLLGPIRMVLTPQPWSILPSASFLLIPAWFHWTFILPALVAGYILFRRNLWFRYGAIYYATCILFYGLIPDLAGPRQRYQAVWAMAWAQFHFAWILAHLSQKKVGSSRKESAVITLPPRLVKAYGPSDPSNNWLRGRRRRENLK
jgi:hypothetical protein